MICDLQQRISAELMRTRQVEGGPRGTAGSRATPGVRAFLVRENCGGMRREFMLFTSSNAGGGR